MGQSAMDMGTNFAYQTGRFVPWLAKLINEKEKCGAQETVSPLALCVEGHRSTLLLLAVQTIATRPETLALTSSS